MTRKIPPLFLVLAIFVAHGVGACPICPTEPLKYAFKRAPIVFEGDLESVDSDGVMHFRVVRQWKGAPVKTVVITNPQSSCAYQGPLVQGERYVVVPYSNYSINCGSHVGDARSAALLDRRAGWWRSPLSSFTLYAIMRRFW